ncbi:MULTISPECIES: glycosyltransferase family 2 protein [Bizionia]|nr:MULTISPECIES: glycosyltransferase [Bizionia]OBX23261.1 hypothetical protein BAA08_05560 [Bizionia sp. APA-3]
MKLSVVIPVYNGENFIKRAYQSVKAQNLEAIDYEIIFIDNNSTDNSAGLIQELLETDSKVKLFVQPKQGEAHARNKGIEKAQGEYLHQLDVDDELYPKALNRMIDVLDKYPEVEAVVGRMVKSNEDLFNTVKPRDETHAVTFKEKPYLGLKWFLDLSSVVGEAAFMHRKSVFEKIGIYNTHISMGTDTALDIKLGMLCNVAYIDTYIYLYFKHFDSITSESKRKINQVHHLWSRTIEADLPLYYEHNLDEEYKVHLFNQVFNTMGKIIYYSDNFAERYMAFKKIPSQVSPLRVAFRIKLYLIVLVFLPIEILLKLYLYYLSKAYVQKHISEF